jgi:lantibiotic biosynthesis protein
MRSSPWQLHLPQPLRDRALKAASLVAERLRAPEQTFAIAKFAVQQSALPSTSSPAFLTFGFGGPAFACAYFDRCFPGQEWDTIAHRYLDTSKLPDLFSHPALYGGISGFGLILTLLSADGTRYRKTRAELNQRLCAKLFQHPGPEAGLQGIAEGEYDLMSGATGILVYLLMLHSEEVHVRMAIERLLTYLVWLSGADQESRRERWYVPQERLVMQQETQQGYPYGYYNCGLAHGIPGPMAALALAWMQGYRVLGQREALMFLRDWMLRYTLFDQWGINWPTYVPLPASQSADMWKRLPPARAGWCYGAPGVARALWLTGLALEEPALCKTAVHAIEAVLQRPATERRLISPTLCHGIAGLLAICLRFAQETESSIIRDYIPLLVEQILDLFNPDFPLGFRDIELNLSLVDQPAWLTGAPGVALTLLAAALPVEPTWDRLLLLS